jgi:roadblock/LC7 domain-containing protein
MNKEIKKSFMLVQGYYGNRNLIDIDENDINKILKAKEESDRVVIDIPNTESLVMIYNRQVEEIRREKIKTYFEEDGYVAKPLAFIPEQNIKVYSTCIVCRKTNDGHFVSFENEDFDKVLKYLAD